MEKIMRNRLRMEHPVYVPLKIAAPLLGTSQRQLSKLVAEGREPFASIGANIGLKQKYIRIYTERLIAYLECNDENGVSFDFE